MKKINSAEILCVGTELLLGDIVNTNAAFLSRELAALGISVYHQSVVGDNPERLRVALEESAARCDLIITSGGLGPTYDDLTKETVAGFFGRKLIRDDKVMEQIKTFFAEMGRTMTKNNEKQADVPEGATVFENKSGTAPGICIEDEESGVTVVMLPGPPRELEPLYREKVRPYLEKRCESVLVSKNINIFGIGESAVENILRPIMEKASNPTVAPYCAPGEVRLRVTAKAENKDIARSMCDEMIEKIMKTEVRDGVYGIDADSIEDVLIKKLINEGRTVATAESCTGGLIAKRLTDVPGASSVYLGSCVTYANSAKEALVGVKHETLEKYGAVSEQTATEMARGVKKALGADIGISTTGIAGPGGGTPEKPVGTVWVGISSEKGDRAVLLRLSPRRERSYLRTLAASNALYIALKE
ncbi:MAG: competence/damage-inducible protein A [Ruminococcaceae bacterium]|nr:competence/damage-inducible protein A [Oscillospiraceae bacterium]